LSRPHVLGAQRIQDKATDRHLTLSQRVCRRRGTEQTRFPQKASTLCHRRHEQQRRDRVPRTPQAVSQLGSQQGTQAQSENVDGR